MKGHWGISDHADHRPRLEHPSRNLILDVAMQSVSDMQEWAPRINGQQVTCGQRRGCGLAAQHACSFGAARPAAACGKKPCGIPRPETTPPGGLLLPGPNSQPGQQKGWVKCIAMVMQVAPVPQYCRRQAAGRAQIVQLGRSTALIALRTKVHSSNNARGVTQGDSTRASANVS